MALYQVSYLYLFYLFTFSEAQATDSKQFFIVMAYYPQIPRPLRTDYFHTQVVLIMCRSVQKQTDVLVFYLSFTYHQCHFPLFVSFYSAADERQL